MRPLPVLLLVTAAVLVVGDRVAESVVEGRVAEGLRDAAGLARAPDVEVAGFPFLTQALAGRYGRVDVTAEGVALAGGLQAEEAGAVVTGARVPPADLLRGQVGGVPADRVEARAEVSFDELERTAAPEAAESLELSAGDAPDVVQVEAVVTVLGREVTVTSQSRVAVEGSRVQVTAGDLRVRDGGADGAGSGTGPEDGEDGEDGEGGGVAQAVLDALTGGELELAVEPGPLPVGLVLRDVQVTQRGLVLLADAEDTVLAAPASAPERPAGTQAAAPASAAPGSAR